MKTQRPRKKPTTKKAAKRKRTARDFVVVTNPSYGAALKGVKIYFEGKKPEKLREDGAIKLGKHILETLKKKYPKFRWIITPATDSISSERGIVRVRTSIRLLGRMWMEEWNRGRDIKIDVVRRYLSATFPEEFTESVAELYLPGTLARILNRELIDRLSSEDKEAVMKFVPAFASAESIGAVSLLRATTQINTLKNLARNLETEIGETRAESWWQSYIQSNILLIQQGYIKALGKLNIAIGNTKFPDFSLVTHDNYLDILEIKRPNTPILRFDKSRGNYFWDPEIAKAIIQVENYIENVGKHQDALNIFLRDTYEIETRAIRPRGIILVGDARRFGDAKIRRDFRLLREGIKNVTILTYDELLTRLRNFISVLEEFSRGSRKLGKA